MTLFQYKAAAPSGEVEEGQADAASQDALVKRLQSQGKIPIRVEPATAGPRRARAAGRGLFKARRVARRDVEVFTVELSTLLQSGLPLDRSLELLTNLADSEPLREMLDGLHMDVRRGSYLSDALQAHERVFSRFYVNMVRAGEAGGALDVALARLSEFLERSRDLRETVISALIYPLILLAIAGLSLLVILGVVIPRISEMFEDAGARLPLVTRVVVDAGAFVNQYWWLVAALAVGGYLYARRSYHTPAGRARWDAWVLGLPLAGQLVGKLEAAP